MRILILGSGGREHALGWKIKQSPVCSKLFIIPGNGGTSGIAENNEISLNDHKAIKDFIIREGIEMMVVGPEVPLVDGIVDYMYEDSKLKGLKIIGPHKNGAMLEGSKSFAKEFMRKNGIPTAEYIKVSKENEEKGYNIIDSGKLAVVVKANGLAAGKGVLICEKRVEAKQKLHELLEGKFGEASEEVVIEEYLEGIEFSIFALTDGKSYVLLPEAKDYKRIGERDTGLNTGGMGAISPVPFVDSELREKVIRKIVEPTIKGIQADKLSYTGFIYFGLISVKGEPYVIEYNCRLGDPETEAILPRIDSDLVELLDAAASGNLKDQKVRITFKHSATVVLASGGYPENYHKGYAISGLGSAKKTGSMIFHAGTVKKNGAYKTNGGRVLMITSLGETLEKALELSYETADRIEFTGKYYRKDIGYELGK